MEKIVAYYRVSTDRQGKSGLGLEAQREAISRHIAGKGEIVAEFTEIESGRKSDRPELIKALAAAKWQRATLIVAKLDRLSRNMAFLSNLIESGVNFRCTDLPQIEGPTGRFLLHQMAAIAELEAGMISARTKAALTAAKARGTKLGGWRPRTGQSDSGALQAARDAAGRLADERATQVSPAIQNLRAGGATSLRELADGLNAARVPTARGSGPWTAMQVQRVMARI